MVIGSKKKKRRMRLSVTNNGKWKPTVDLWYEAGVTKNREDREKAGTNFTG